MVSVKHDKRHHKNSLQDGGKSCTPKITYTAAQRAFLERARRRVIAMMNASNRQMERMRPTAFDIPLPQQFQINLQLLRWHFGIHRYIERVWKNVVRIEKQLRRTPGGSRREERRRRRLETEQTFAVADLLVLLRLWVTCRNEKRFQRFEFIHWIKTANGKKISRGSYGHASVAAPRAITAHPDGSGDSQGGSAP